MIAHSANGASEISLIRAYGEFWSRRAVLWKKGQLNAERRHFRGTNKPRDVDVWRQRGVYALEHDFKIVYVGQANDRDLGQRLKEHTTDRLARRWDTFSWYGIREIQDDGSLRDYNSSHVNQSALIRTLELIAISMSDAPLNRSRGKIPGAEKLVQKDYRRIRDVHDKLDDILKSLRALSEKM